MPDSLALPRIAPWRDPKAALSSRGFTLIELMVVIALISLMLVFAFPKFGETLLVDETRKTSIRILAKINSLKLDAVQDNRDYFLHFNIDTNKIWVSDNTMTEEQQLKARMAGFDLPRSLRIIDVAYPSGDAVRTGQADVLFSRKGYSNKALIHLEDRNGHQVSLLIEPFLSRARLYDSHVSFQF